MGRRDAGSAVSENVKDDFEGLMAGRAHRDEEEDAEYLRHEEEETARRTVDTAMGSFNFNLGRRCYDELSTLMVSACD